MIIRSEYLAAMLRSWLTMTIAIPSFLERSLSMRVTSI